MKRPPLTRIQVGIIEDMVDKSATLEAAAHRLTTLHTPSQREYAYALVCRRFGVKLPVLLLVIENLEQGEDD